MRVRVKVCGIRSAADLAVAVEAGADAVGFICGTTHVSEDALDPQEAAALSAATPPYVTRVLVTHLESADAVLGLADRVGCDVIQVHGLVTRDTTLAIFRGAGGRRVTAALHVTGSEAVGAARALADCAHALHLDSRTADRLGGTGRTHDWSVSRRIVTQARERGQPVVLAGGLTPGNVRAAIAAVGPYAVDVNSGVEDDRGDKEPGAVAAFVEAARATG